ncbi:MAG: hypothetical protein GY790_23320 [Bacteroidetes bacterium]|nr:hypothetical protein [Bacteroidota bacterium]
MSKEQLHDIYSQRITSFQSAVSHHTRLMNYLSLIRLLSLVAMVWFIVLAIKHHNPVFYGCSAVMLIIFLLLVKRFIFQKDLRNLNTRLRKLNELETACLNHQFRDMPDGMEFADPSHPWSHDLDLFGRGSLYQYLNRTSTLKGKTILANILTTEPESQEVIENRQRVIGNLKERIDFRQTFTARGAMFEEQEGDIAGIEKWLTSSAYITKHRWLFYLALGISALTIFIIVYGIIVPGGTRYLLYPLLFNFAVLSPFLARTGRYQQSISKKHNLLEGYALLLKLIAETPFENQELMENQMKAKGGMREVVRLSKLLNLFDQRLNMLLGIIFNGLFLFDFIMLHLLERWKRKNRDMIMEWIHITGHTDALISLSGFAWNHPGFITPRIEGEQGPIEVKGLGHPLIRTDKRVDNDLSINDEQVVIITGANMAGKSTFLRALGINTLLAYTGCPVCATTFRMGFIGLFSSMRTADSLADEESYFLAEIKRLQRIVKRMEAGHPMLILLDEVLKGTNTTDKKLGSVGLITRSLPYPVKCFIATHDLSLGELEKMLPGKVVNYCFESYIQELELTFDYTIRKGIATNMNASFLMKQMGIMD